MLPRSLLLELLVWSLPKTAAREAGREMRAVFDKLAIKMETT